MMINIQKTIQVRYYQSTFFRGNVLASINVLLSHASDTIERDKCILCVIEYKFICCHYIGQGSLSVSYISILRGRNGVKVKLQNLDDEGKTKAYKRFLRNLLFHFYDYDYVKRTFLAIKISFEQTDRKIMKIKPKCISKSFLVNVNVFAIYAFMSPKYRYILLDFIIRWIFTRPVITRRDMQKKNVWLFIGIATDYTAERGDDRRLPQ